MSGSDNFEITDEPPTPEELAIVRDAGPETREKLDAALLRSASKTWRKMARLVADAMIEMEPTLPTVSYAYYGHRLRQLVETGILESRGELSVMRFCELRLREQAK